MREREDIIVLQSKYAQLAISPQKSLYPHLELNGETLRAGSPLVLYIQSHEIAGHVELDEWGWYLDTSEVAIMLHTGLWARLPR